MEELRLSRGQDWLHEWRGIVESKDIAQDQTRSSEDNRLPDDVFKDKAKDAVGGEGDAVSTGGGGQPEGDSRLNGQGEFVEQILFDRFKFDADIPMLLRTFPVM